MMMPSAVGLPAAIFLAGVFLAGLSAGALAEPPAIISSEQVIRDADEIAEAQLKALAAKSSNNWLWGVMEAGYADFSHISPQGATYSNTLTAWAEKQDWTLPTVKKGYLIQADDFCIGQTYLDLYVSHPSAGRIDPLKKRLDVLVEHINSEAERPAKLIWFWCDALFMAPPVLSRMSAITGDQSYINAMDTEYWRTAASLYDGEEHLFYRDSRFIGKKDSRGRKIFWSRGNGWVVAGLARVLQYMPSGHPTRPKYVALFKDLAARLVSLQSSDGTWHSSLLDPKLFDGPETSGTSLITYAIAWGINHNLLNRETYLPVVARAWTAMIADRRPDGLPGYVQGVAYEPKGAEPDGTQLYTTGSTLLDAVEILKLTPIDVPQSAGD